MVGKLASYDCEHVLEMTEVLLILTPTILYYPQEESIITHTLPTLHYFVDPALPHEVTTTRACRRHPSQHPTRKRKEGKVETNSGLWAVITRQQQFDSSP